MNTELDCDLTPDQWETLKALRAPALPARSRSRYVLESLIALDLVSIDDGLVVITARGREDMAPLYAAEVLGVNALLRTSDGWRRIPAEMRRKP